MPQNPETVLITGAGQRIGRAMAVDLARAGWRIAVHCNRSQASAEDTCREIEAAGGRAAVVQGDLADGSIAEGLIEKSASALGPVTCLINNASMFEADRVETVTDESWAAHMNVNLRAPLFLTQSFAARLPEGLDGAVINIIDQRVWNLGGGYTSYTLSKYGLWGLTQVFARALAPRIRVNAIGPGPTLPSSRQSEEQFTRQWKSTPLAQPVDPQEICRAARFILDAAAMTGQMIALDSGQHMGLGFVDDVEDD